MDADGLIRHDPLLFHMTDARTWPTIERLGLRSVSSLLDLFEIDGDLRRRLECQRRPHSTTLSHRIHGEVVIRDQRPLNVDKLAACLIDMTVTDWLRLLSRKVFFWLSQDRVDKLLGAQLYRDRAHAVLVVDTASLVCTYEDEITLAPINTGATLYSPPPRGSGTLVPIRDYPFKHWRRLRRTPRNAVAELAVDYAVPDILEHAVRVELRQHSRDAEVITPS